MKLFKTIWLRLRSLWQRCEVKREIDEELRFHIEQRTAENVAAGMAPEEAAREARKRFGNLQSVREECRERRGASFGEATWQDVRFGLRILWKNPGFTTVAVLTLALGIGANTAIFSSINSALLKPLPYPHAEQLVDIAEQMPESRDRYAVSGGAFKDWREHSSKFAHLAIYEGIDRNLTGKGTPEHVTGMQVSAEFLSVLGVAPIIGRDFAAGESAVGGDSHVILLTHQCWQSRYGGDIGILGKVVLLDQVTYTVIGALPPRALLQDDVEFLIPEVIDAPGENWTRHGHWRQVIGRLLPGASAAEAQAELRGIKQQLMAEYPSYKEKWSVLVTPLREICVGDVRPVLVLLLGAVALVLLIACANVSNLLLARGNVRSREMAVRIALGAHSWRIIRQMLTESLLLAMSGCALGLLFAAFGIRLLAGMMAEQLPGVLRPQLDIHVLMFSALVACGCAILFGILPAWRAARADVNHALKETERGSAPRSKRRLQSFLVVSEFALTLVLLIGAGLFLRSFIRLTETDPGFDPRHSLAFDLSFPKVKYPGDEDRLRVTKDVIGRIQALPGVESVGAVSALPLSTADWGEPINRTDKPEPPEQYNVGVSGVSGDCFAAIGVRLMRGRAITEADNRPTAPPVLVIDSGVARDLYPNEDPLGKSLNMWGTAYEIVGVAAPVRHGGIENDPRPRVYGAQARFHNGPSIVVRSALPPMALIQAVRKAVLEADPDQPIANVRTLEEAVQKSLAPRRTILILLGLFAVVAISLACIGIYGVMSNAIGQRSHELGIRSALGAQRGDIIRLVLVGGMKPSFIGIGVGLAIAFGLARLLENQLFQVNAHDPLVFVASVCLLGIVALLSVYFPARRAARLNPMLALRNE